MTDSPVSTPAMRAHSRKQSSLRYIASLVLSVLAGASLLLASVGLWVNNTIFNSSRFASTVENVLEEPEVNLALSRYLTTQVMDNIAVEESITNILPDQIESLAPFLVGAVRNVVQEGVQRVLAQERVLELIGDQVEKSHKGLMFVLENRGPFGKTVTTDGNRVILDLRAVLENALDDVERSGVLLERLNVPEDFGQLVVYEGDAVESSSTVLRAAQDGLSLFKRLLWVYIVAAPLFMAASIYVASSRRHAIRRLGIVCAAVAAAASWTLSQIGPAVGNMIANPEARPAAKTIVDAFVSRLKGFSAILFWLSIVVIAVATFYNFIVAQYQRIKTTEAN
jgi:hypothetical protein